jgi:hypothetical protein
MNIKKYDELRKKINTKDFEGKNKKLDKWLYWFSFIGNMGSIFFAYFLLYPSLYKAISFNVTSGSFAIVLSFVMTNILLVIFEIIKRYFVKNFSTDFVINNNKINASILGWFIAACLIVGLSFYLSVDGSKKLASVSSYKNNIAELKTTNSIDSINNVFNNEKLIYINDNEELRKINIELRQKLTNTPVKYVVIRKDYQDNIDKNMEIIKDNQNTIIDIENNIQTTIKKLNDNLDIKRKYNKSDDTGNIILFIIIAIFVEIIIIGGIYFREWYEYNLYLINQQKFEKIYQKKNRYGILLQFIYLDGKLDVGDKVITGLDLKAVVQEKTKIQNYSKFVDEFLHDMDNLGIFVITGKRRHIGKTYIEAIDIIENYDDSHRILENLK